MAWLGKSFQVRLSDECHTMIDEILKEKPLTYNSKAHFLRCAVMREIIRSRREVPTNI